MDYEKLHKDTINNLQQMVRCGKITVETARSICADFTLESQDERIRKALIDGFKRYNKNGLFNKCLVREILDWLEKQKEQEQLYIRFGEIPANEKSKIYQGEVEVGTEKGVSVYSAFKTDKGDIVLGLSLPITRTTLYTQQHLIEYDDRPCYLVNGDYVGKDTDGQPLIKNVKIIKKIDKYRAKEEKKGLFTLEAERYFSESEENKDDIIRKEIAEYFKHYSGGDSISIKFPEWIAWLEKQ